MGGERAGQADETGGDGEGHHLGVGDVDAHRGRGDVVVAHRHERAPQVRAEQVACGQHGEGGHGQQGDVPHQLPHRSGELDAEELERPDVQVALTAGEPLPAAHHEQDDGLRGQGRDREVQPLEPERRQPEERPDDGGEQDRGGDGHGRGHPGALVQQRGGERADGEEPALAEGDLAGEADQDVQAYGAHDGDQDGVDDAEPVHVHDERQHGERQDDDQEAGSLGTGVPQREVGAVGAVVHPGGGRWHGLRPSLFVSRRTGRTGGPGGPAPTRCRARRRRAPGPGSRRCTS